MPSTPRGDDPPPPAGRPGDDGTGAPQAAPGRPVGEMRLGDHLCLSYDNAEEHRAILTAYLRDALRDDHKVIYVSDDAPPEEVLDRFRRGPDAGDLDLPAMMGEGRFVVRTAEEAYLATGRFDPDEIVGLFATEIELAMLQGYRGLRMTCEKTFSLRGWPGSDRFTEFERKIDHIFRTAPVPAMAICQYDRRWFGRDQLRELESYHAGRVRVDDRFDNGTLRITPTFTPPGLALAGAIDESTCPAVEEALRTAGVRSAHLCLDLSRLEFCDMAGLRALVGAGRTPGGMERQVILREPPEQLALMMRITGWDALPGVYVEEAPR
ncbi:MAG TPA: MEDS domain-containing protein [Thermomonospora sp.]|nr:MEDS domain-containing protein [Thermomonospora sp.]